MGMRENLLKEQAKIIEEKLKLAEERAHLEALSKLNGVSSASFDIIKARAEVHGALEATKKTAMDLNEERQKLCDLQHTLEMERWSLQEYDQDLAARTEHLNIILKESELNKEEGQKALENAKRIQMTAEEKMAAMELRMTEILEREKKLIKEKMELTQEEIRLDKRREHLDQILPELSDAENLFLQPVTKSVIDPKMLIMKLKAEKDIGGIYK
uniref:Uncharacterized protein n=1 Tax=Clastoptera arizonana TaxID=38151 RepID=A0A1B6DSA8_9HEMI